MYCKWSRTVYWQRLMKIMQWHYCRQIMGKAFTFKAEHAFWTASLAPLSLLPLLFSISLSLSHTRIEKTHCAVRSIPLHLYQSVYVSPLVACSLWVLCNSPYWLCPVSRDDLVSHRSHSSYAHLSLHILKKKERERERQPPAWCELYHAVFHWTLFIFLYLQKKTYLLALTGGHCQFY